MKKRNLVFILVISLTVAGLLALTGFLNIVSFRNTYASATAASNAVVAGGAVSKIEYTLKYGKSLDNYFGVEAIFKELQETYGYLKTAYIVNAEGKAIYGAAFTEGAVFSPPGDVAAQTAEAIESGDNAFWIEENAQEILLPIRDRAGEKIACLGLSYDIAVTDEKIEGYLRSEALYTALAIIIGITLLTLLYYTVRHGFNGRKLLLIVITVVVVANLFFGVTAYGVFRAGYMALTRQTADIIGQKIVNDVGSVISGGVEYKELSGMEEYFDDMLGKTEQLESIALARESDDPEAIKLASDRAGESYALSIRQSEAYVNGKLTGIMIEIAVSILTSLMIAAEIIIFVVAALTGREKAVRLRAGTIVKTADVSLQPSGIVRGLTFFFSMFQYTAAVFVTLAIIEVYRPVSVFGFELPYALVISLPLTAQMLFSMLGSFLGGKTADRRGWKASACAGILLMAAGSALAGAAGEPLLFVCAQAVMGLGLGAAKNAFDVYAIMASSEADMEKYTSNANASSVVGLSCASSIGAIIAGALGYAGAYAVMAGVGVFVAGLIALFGQNARAPARAEKAEKAEKKKGFSFDARYALYLLFAVTPYYFVSMYLDYFFPVFASDQGVGTAAIGYVFLAYGICTSYIGAFLCHILTKRFRAALLMAALIFLLGVGLGIFAVNSVLALSVAFVLLMALFDGVMPTLQFKYVCSLPITQRIGVSRALGVEGAITGAIRGVAPMVFGLVMMAGTPGFLLTAGAVSACALVFYLTTRREGKRNA